MLYEISSLLKRCSVKSKKSTYSEYKQDTDSALSDRARTISYMKQQILLQKTYVWRRNLFIFRNFWNSSKYWILLSMLLITCSEEKCFSWDPRRNRNESRSYHNIIHRRHKMKKISTVLIWFRLKWKLTLSLKRWGETSGDEKVMKKKEDEEEEESGSEYTGSE